MMLIKPGCGPRAGRRRPTAPRPRFGQATRHGWAVFELLRHGRRVKPEAHLIAFDLVELDGRNLTAKPLQRRKA
jgi:hypothetical protein